MILLILIKSLFLLENPFDFKASKEPTYVEADSLTLNQKERKFNYQGKVKVTQGDITMTTDVLEGIYNENNEIETLNAKKNVVIVKGEKLRATGENAVYDAKTEIITLTGNPEVTEGESQLLADIIKIYVAEDRSEAEGNVRMKLVKKEQ
jgi:lipopolysaccharide export system protein LptA